MLRIGCAVLSVWSALNLLMSLKIVFDTLVSGSHTPALYLILTEADVRALSPDTLATMDSIAVFANGLNAAFCTLALGLIWGGLAKGRKWSFPPLLIGFSFAWLAGVGSDFAVGHAAPWVNMVSLVILSVGFLFSALGLRRALP